MGNNAGESRSQLERSVEDHQDELDKAVYQEDGDSAKPKRNLIGRALHKIDKRVAGALKQARESPRALQDQAPNDKDAEIESAKLLEHPACSCKAGECSAVTSRLDSNSQAPSCSASAPEPPTPVESNIPDQKSEKMMVPVPVEVEMLWSPAAAAGGARPWDGAYLPAPPGHVGAVGGGQWFLSHGMQYASPGMQYAGAPTRTAVATPQGVRPLISHNYSANIG